MISVPLLSEGKLRMVLGKASNFFGEPYRTTFDLQLFVTSHALLIRDLSELLLAFVLNVARDTGWGNGLCGTMSGPS